MTLVIGLSSDDGVLLASDSQVSLGEVSIQSQKLHVSDDGRFAFGMAGDAAVIQHLVRDLKEAQLPDDAEGVREVLERIYSDRMAALRDLAAASLGPDFPVDALPPPHLVVATYCSGMTRIFLVDHRSICLEIEEGFIAIGSGASFADHALLVAFDHLWGDGFDWPHAAILCGRVIRDSVAASGPSVAIGGEPQYILIDDFGARSLSDQYWANLFRFHIDTWRAQEAETFRSAVATPIPPDLSAPFETSTPEEPPEEPET